METNDSLFSNVSNQMEGFQMVRLPNIDFMLSRLPNNIFDYLTQEINKIKENFELSEKFTDKLAGHIKHEYNFMHCKEAINDFVINHISWYDKEYNIAPSVLTKSCRFSLSSLWVNFQKKHEFNPPHSHSGVFSFVIWMKIPFILKDEMELYKEGTMRQTSRFGFITSNRAGQLSTSTIPVDKSYEGVVCFFPSWMTHYVNPFYTSDDYRISISGNVFYDVDQSIKD